MSTKISRNSGNFGAGKRIPLEHIFHHEQYFVSKIQLFP